MPDDNRNVKIRVKSGDSEAEVEASLSDIHEAINLIPEVLAKLPLVGTERRSASFSQAESVAPHLVEAVATSVPATSGQSSVPVVTIEKGDSLSEVISKFFSDSWGRSPKKLMEVREALQSYGLNYPKQSVAVALLRLAKSSKIRRFKGEGGEYVYTASTGAVRISAPMQPSGPQPIHQEEASPELEDIEEQLDLNPPSAN